MEVPSDARETISETLAPPNPDREEPKESEEEDRFIECDERGPERGRILAALEVVEKDSAAIAESYSSLFSSLRLALSEVTATSVEHMQCFSDAAGRLQESALDATTKGNRYINSCLRLNQELKGIENLAIQLKILRRNVDALESAVNRFL